MQEKGLESQIRAIQEFCKRQDIENFVIFQDENQSGVKKSRPALDEMMTRVRNNEAESVIVYSFSRFARSVTHLLSALEEFKEFGVRFTSISENLDTDTPLGKALFTILASVSQLERDILIERVRNGLANARAKGIKIGRKKTRPSELIRKLRSKGLVYREIARIAGCSQGAVSAELKAWAKEKKLGTDKPLSSDIPLTPTPVPTEEKKLNQVNSERSAPLEIVRF